MKHKMKLQNSLWNYVKLKKNIKCGKLVCGVSNQRSSGSFADRFSKEVFVKVSQISQGNTSVESVFDKVAGLLFNGFCYD